MEFPKLAVRNVAANSFNHDEWNDVDLARFSCGIGFRFYPKAIREQAVISQHEQTVNTKRDSRLWSSGHVQKELDPPGHSQRFRASWNGAD
jgi:hypothetical protein